MLVIREEGDIWIYQYRHKEFPDSLAYFIYKPTVNGSRVAPLRLKLGKSMDNKVRKVSFLDDSDQGAVEILQGSQWEN